MKAIFVRSRFTLWTTAFVFSLYVPCGSGCSFAADAKLARPATVSDAAQVIDLSKLPLLGASTPAQQTGLSQLTYQAGGEVKAVYEFHRKQLTNQGWKELPQAQVTEQYASGTFGKNGFTVSMSVMPTGEAGKVGVTMLNHGNIDLNKLPLPAGTKPLYVGPASAIFTATGSVEESLKAIKSSLEKLGWQPYGDAGDQHFYRQNAIRLSAVVMSAPAEAGKTMITYSSEQLSAELPAPTDAIGLQYSDATHQVLFDTEKSEADIMKFYQESLAPAKWKSTLDKPIKIDFHDVVIFRNPAKDLIELHMYNVENLLRVQATWQSAAEVAELERRAKEAIEKEKMKKNMPLAKIPVTLPVAAQGIEQSPSQIEFKLTSGTAKAAIRKFQQELEKAGWKLDDKFKEFQDQVGKLTFVKGDQELSILYVDPGFIPAEVTLSAQGGELQIQKAP